MGEGEILLSSFVSEDEREDDGHVPPLEEIRVGRDGAAVHAAQRRAHADEHIVELLPLDRSPLREVEHAAGGGLPHGAERARAVLRHELS